jgi:hypothetical protein
VLPANYKPLREAYLYEGLACSGLVMAQTQNVRRLHPHTLLLLQQ